MADKVQRGKLSQFKPAERNSNKHTAKGLKALANSMSNDGYVAPMTAAADGEILDGSARLETAFEKFGDNALIVKHDGKTPIVMVREDIPNADDPLARRIHYRANMVSWLDFSLDPDIVMADIEAGFNFEAIDISLPDLGEMLEGAARELLRGNGQVKDAEPQIDKAAQLKEQWGTELGQVWEMPSQVDGRPHRIVCGDCTDRAVVEAVMKGKKFNLMTTDPPYGVNYEGGRNPVSNVPREKLEGDTDPGLYNTFLSIWKGYRQDKGVLYIWFAASVGKPVYDAVIDNGFEVRALIIWNKVDPHYGNFMAQYLQKHEPCLYCVKDGTNWYGPTNEVTVWDIKQPNINEFHPTQKPLECMIRPMENSSKVGDIVVDPFLGSGTTLIAAHNLHRIARGIEIDPGYVAVALQRYQDATGIEPRLVSTQ